MTQRTAPWVPALPHRPVDRPLRGPVLFAVAVALVTAAILPLASHRIGEADAFPPVQLTAVGCCDLLALLLLGREFHRTGDTRILGMSVAYCWSIVTMVGHALTFPGLVSAHPPLATAPSVTTWLHVLWHVGFPVLIAVSWLPREHHEIPEQQRARHAAGQQIGATLTAAGVVALVIGVGPHLPVLVRGNDTQRLTEVTAPVCLPLLLLALVICWRARQVHGAARWAYAAVTVSAADMSLFYAAGERYTLGWYAGRLLTVAGAGVIAGGLLGDLFRTQDTLATDRALHDFILANLTEGVILRDLDGKVLMANAAAETVMELALVTPDGSAADWPADAVFRRLDGTPIAPGDYPAQVVLRDGVASRDAVLGLPGPDGETMWVSANACPIRDADGVLRGVVSSFSDVTAHQTAMNELATARDAALAGTRAKSEFLATVSHEIRTPLNGLLGLNGLLMSTSLSQEQRSYVEGATSCGQALLALVEGVLDLSTIEAGASRSDSVDFGVSDIARRSLDAVREPAERHGLNLSVQIDVGVPGTLRGDGPRLRQLLTNLLANAVKFTDTGDISVVISTTERTDGTDDAAGDLLLRVEVHDTGIGIDPADTERLFEPFVQADASTTRRYGGSGLGLSIVRQFARLMGGDAGATGEPGVGSTFWFTAAVSRTDPTAPARAPRPVGDWSTLKDAPRLRGRVLLAEDNSVNQLIATRVLTSWGLEVDAVTDGAAAVAACDRGEYDLVVMDCQMPVLDGFDATVQIHDLPGRGGLPVIALTASTLTDDVKRCAAAGMVGHLTKPLDPVALYRVLSRYLPAAVSRPIPGPRTTA